MIDREESNLQLLVRSLWYGGRFFVDCLTLNLYGEGLIVVEMQ